MPGPRLTQAGVAVKTGDAVTEGVSVKRGVDVSVGGFGVLLGMGVSVGKAVLGAAQLDTLQKNTAKKMKNLRIMPDLNPK